MAHHVGAPDCDAELEMVASFAGRPPEAERDRELARGRPAASERRDSAGSPSHESA